MKSDDVEEMRRALEATKQAAAVELEHVKAKQSSAIQQHKEMFDRRLAEVRGQSGFRAAKDKWDTQIQYVKDSHEVDRKKWLAEKNVLQQDLKKRLGDIRAETREEKAADQRSMSARLSRERVAQADELKREREAHADEIRSEIHPLSLSLSLAVTLPTPAAAFMLSMFMSLDSFKQHN